MKIKSFEKIFKIILSFAFVLLYSSCTVNTSGTANENAIEYRNDEVSYADGESCLEYYCLFEETGKYKRYMSGMYFGQEVRGGIFSGLLFETGEYKTITNEDEDSQKITFYPKKRYDFDKKDLDYLGLEKQVPYYGTLTESELSIPWSVWLSYFDRREVSIIYSRRK